MKAKITKKDGSVVEMEGTVEELSKFIEEKAGINLNVQPAVFVGCDHEWETCIGYNYCKKCNTMQMAQQWIYPTYIQNPAYPFIYQSPFICQNTCEATN